MELQHTKIVLIEVERIKLEEFILKKLGLKYTINFSLEDIEFGQIIVNVDDKKCTNYQKSKFNKKVGSFTLEEIMNYLAYTGHIINGIYHIEI